MMQCPVQNGNPEILLDYCARKLRPETAGMLERHITGCAECRRFADGQKQIWSALDLWEAEPVAADFDQRLYRRIESTDRGAFWSRVLGDRFMWRPALPIAAACATAALAVILVVPRSTPPPAPAQPSVMRADSLEAEQVERTLEDIEMLKQLTAPAAAKSL